MTNFFRQLRKQSPRQDGVTLLLTIMIVSGIGVISATVAYFVVQEVRNARSSALTEPAIIAAETAGEQGIYMVKRSSFNTTCSSASYTHLDGTTTSGSTDTRIRKCQATEDVIFEVEAATPLTFILYDYINRDGNTCMEDDAFCPAGGGGIGNQLYTSLTVTHLSGSTVTVDVESLDGLFTDQFTVAPGATGTFNIPRDILGANDERLVFTVTPSSGTASIHVTTAGLAGYAPGLPDYLTIDAEGCKGLGNITSCESTNEIYKRRINITLPR